MSDETRRPFLERLSNFGVLASLTAAYGTFAAFALRYLYPDRGVVHGWQFVAEVDRFAVGDAMTYVAPDGATVALARQGDSGEVGDFIALSSTCPHLGCQVHWEGNNNRFFCPCHNGSFDPAGKPIEGPPAEANQSLPRYPLKVESGLLYIDVPLKRLAQQRTGITKPGHDACLLPMPSKKRSV